MEDKNLLVEVTADVVSSYVTKNEVALVDLPDLIMSVHKTFAQLGGSAQVAEVVTDQIPAVPISASISENHLVCLEDGLQFKSLKRHLRSHHGLSADQYREKWGLPADYPMVAPNYSEKRRTLAKKMKLGHKR